MSDDSRNQILEDFMGFTSLEDMGECITILDQYNWNLMAAVQAVQEKLGLGGDSTVPKHSTATNHQSSTVKKPTRNGKLRPHSDSDDNSDSDDVRVIKSVPGHSKAPKGASGGPSRVRELQFDIEYKDRTEHITIYDQESVHQLKLKIEQKVSLPPNRQKFTNIWCHKGYTDHTVLKDLNLPAKNTIHLISTSTSTANGASRSSTTTSTATATASRNHRRTTSPTKISSSGVSPCFPLTVYYEEKPGKSVPYELVLSASATVLDMKREMEQVGRIPIREQVWVDLPSLRDSEQLQNTSISRKAQLQLRRSGSSSTQQASSHRRDMKHSTSTRHRTDEELMDTGAEVYSEPFDDDVTIVPQHNASTTASSSSSSNRELLIPDNCTNDRAGLEHFNRVFHSRFGTTGPLLFIGSLDQAIQESVAAPRNERRPLAVYIHCDRSVCANVFCTQVLRDETIVEYLASNYLFWAWDITTDSNRARLIEMFKRCVGPQHTQRLIAMDKDSYPLLLILIRSRGSLELVSTIEGNNTPGEVILNLIQAHELFQQQQLRDAEEEIVRENREDLKKQQEAEYNQSLQADLAKERARLDDERRQKEEQMTKDRLEKQRLQEQRDCIARLPKEPSETEKNTTRLKIRLPNDEGILMRRFRINDTLQVLFDYLTTQGRMFGDYRLLSAFPKRDLTTLNRSETFEQLKLYPQEQLILETV